MDTTQIHRPELLEPYDQLSQSLRDMLDVLVEENPKPSEVEKALNGLLDEVLRRSPKAKEKAVIASIANAAISVATPIQHFPDWERQIEGNNRVRRWFGKLPGPKNGSNDDGPDVPERTLPMGRKRQRQDER